MPQQRLCGSLKHCLCGKSQAECLGDVHKPNHLRTLQLLGELIEAKVLNELPIMVNRIMPNFIKFNEHLSIELPCLISEILRKAN